jgi:hypothetical protein
MMKLNDDEKKVLAALADTEFCGEEYGYKAFASLMKMTGLDRKVVRRACRSLKRKELAMFSNGLWTESGEAAGSGYSATKAGRELVYQLALDEEK